MKKEGRKTGTEEPQKARASARLALRAFSHSHLLFYAAGFIYLWLVVEPHLIYYCFGTILPDAPPFATGWAFLKEALGQPGGPVLYVAGLLSQGFYHAWLGALIIVLAGFCLAELLRRHLVTAGGRHAWLLAPFPALPLFLIYSHYKHPLALSLAVSLGLLLSLLLERLPLRRPVTRVAAAALAMIVGFWLGGGGTLLILVVLTVAYRVFMHRDWIVGALVPAVGAVIVWAMAQYVFLLPVPQVLLVLTPLAPFATTGMDTLLEVLTFSLYALAPGLVLLVLVGRALFVGRASPRDVSGERGRSPHEEAKPGGRARKRRAKDGAWYAPSRLAPPLLAAVPLILMALGLYFTQDPLGKPFVRSNCYAHRKQWDKIVALSQRLPQDRTNVYVNHDRLRALYHTGRLPYDMFLCPLVPEAVLLTHEKGESDLTLWKLSDIFLELGHVNMAQKLGSELLATKSHLGTALEALGWIGVIKNDPGVARVYWKALRKDLRSGTRAASLLQGLSSGFAPEQAARIESIRACMRSDTAAVTGGEPVDETLAALLKHNPRNKMAFEYLMACYLVTGRVDQIAANMARLPALGYREVPTLYQEALLIHYGSTGRTAVALADLGISPQTYQRYEAFVQVNNALQTQKRPELFQRLVREFGTSYFFYYLFGRVGLVQASTGS